MIPELTERPRPVPLPVSLVVKKGRKIFCNCSWLMPVPSSLMAMRIVCSARLAAISIRPEPSIASAALFSRLRTTCPSWFASVVTGGSPGS